MKNLLLIRHAKSSWEDPELKDSERPLTKRGIQDALIMANVLKKYNFKIDKIFCSTATRAKMTIEIFAGELNINSNVITCLDELYLVPRENLIDLIKGFDDELTNVVIVGHNPGLTDLSHFLLNNFYFELSTCALVSIELKIDRWSDLKRGVGILKFFEYPKKYR